MRYRDSPLSPYPVAVTHDGHCTSIVICDGDVTAHRDLALNSPASQSLLSPIGEQKLPHSKPSCVDERVASMPPPEMIPGAKPTKHKIQVVTKVIASTQYQEAHDCSEMNSPASVVPVDDEGIHKAPHCPAHAERAEENCPHESGEEVSEPREGWDAYQQNRHLEDERAKPE